MKERVDVPRPSRNGPHGARPAERRAVHLQSAELHVPPDGAVTQERKPRLDALPLQHLKRARERVIVNRGRTVDPEKSIDVKPPAAKQRHRRLAETARRIPLLRKVAREDGAHDVVGVQPLVEPRGFEVVGAQIRKRRKVEIEIDPGALQRVAELVYERNRHCATVARAHLLTAPARSNTLEPMVEDLGTLVAGAHVVSQPTEQGAVLLEMTSGECFELNRVGAEIWGGITKGVALSQVVQDVASRYRVSASTVESDARALVAELKRRGLLTSDRK
jgi:hypothetical protein